MSRSGKGFVGLLPTLEKRAKSSFFGSAGTSILIRDQFTISSWLCLGAIVQGGLFLALGRLSLIPAVLVILYRVLNAYLMAVGWKHNHYMDGVIHKKFSAQFPNADTGLYGNTPANDDVVVLLIGTRSNHPFGAFAPNFDKVGEFFQNMAKELDANPEEYDYLGMTTWLNASERKSKSEIMSVGYFRSYEGLHKFAHSEHHRVAWDWWNREIKSMPHISIFHETYHVPKGHWESITENSHLNGINSTMHKVFDTETGEDKWATPVVDASKGQLRTSAGRMNRAQGDENEKYGKDPYEMGLYSK